MILDWQTVGNGCRKADVRMHPAMNNSTSRLHESDLLGCWLAVVNWVRQLLAEDRDIPLVDAM